MNGDGPPVLLLHAGISDGRLWDALVPLLAGFRLIRPDLRGFGETVAAPGGYSPIGDLLAVLDRLEVERVAVCGVSFGAALALALASEHPTRVSHVAALCPLGVASEPSAELIGRIRAIDRRGESGDHAGAAEAEVELWLGPAGERERTLAIAMATCAWQVGGGRHEAEVAEPLALAAIGAHALIGYGELDRDDCRRDATAIAELVSRAELVALAGCGHLPPLERPELVAALLRGLVS